MNEKSAGEFIEQSVYRIKQNTPKIISCINELNEGEIWKRPNTVTNSVANLVIHLCGNIQQYIISSLGETKDTRERDLEFSVNGVFTKAGLIDKLNTIVDQAIAIIEIMDTEMLVKKRSVQGFNSSGIGNIIQVAEHYSYHTGQIVLFTKLLRNKDLEFYAGIDLNKKNQL